MIPTNSFGQLAVTTVSLLFSNYTNVSCSANSTPCYDVQCMAPCVADTNTYDLLCHCLVNIGTHFTVSELSVGQITYTNVPCIVNTYQYSDVTSVVVSQAMDDSTLWCHCSIATESNFTVADLDIGYTTSDSVSCCVMGELYNNINCSITTGRHDADLLCGVSGASSPDYYSDINCETTLQAGEVIDYLTFEVVLGDRYMSTVRCHMKPAEAMSGTLMCGTSYVLAGQPRWSRFNAEGYTVIRLYNMGQYSVVAAILRDDEKVVSASTIEQLGNLWQAKFDNSVILAGPQIIVLTIEPGTKAIVVDTPTGTFSL